MKRRTANIWKAKTRKILLISSGVLFILLLAAGTIFYFVAWRGSSSASNGLPSLHLTTRYDPFAVERDFWHDAQISVTAAAPPQYDAAPAVLMSDIPVRLRGRGNSTWGHGQEKRPLRLRFDEPAYLLGSSHAARDWVLISNLFDMSLVRTHLAFHMSGLLDGIGWTPFSRLVNVYINGVYAGVYQLADERNTEAGRAALRFDPDPARSEFLLEIDGSAPSRERRLSEGETENVDFTFVNGWVIDVRYPRRADRDGHMEYLQNFLYRVDTVIKSHDYAAVAALVDMDSLIDFYLLLEFFKPIDAGDRSIFMQLKGHSTDRRLHFGPVWDFDRSAGNMIAWYAPEHIFAGHYNSWFADLLAAPEIAARIAARWREIRPGAVTATIAYARYLLDNYEAALAQNFDAHPHIFGGEPAWFWLLPEHTRILRSHRAQMEYLISWLENRAEWLDGYFSHP